MYKYIKLFSLFEAFYYLTSQTVDKECGYKPTIGKMLT